MVKINSLELENVKRIKTVTLTPAENGLTIIGGKNGQGKTSVLDAIAWALGGDKFKPSGAHRDTSVVPPHLKVTLSNGLVVERSGDSSRLKVTDPNGKKGGQQLLNEFIEALALDLPKFMAMNAKDKAKELLKIIGVGDELYRLDTEEKRLYNQRTEVGRIADQKEKHAKELPVYSGLPDEPVSAMELIQSQQEILARNGENKRKRDRLAEIQREYNAKAAELEELTKRVEELKSDLATALKSAEELEDESTAEIEAQLADIDELNTKIRANQERERAEEDAADIRSQYNDLTERIEAIRAQRTALLNGAKMPLSGLSVDDGELTYKGARWDCMSGSEQLQVATAIVRNINPNCGFVLLDKLEQMDTDTLREFGEWLEGEGLQVIATRVSMGGECTVIIEDGESVAPAQKSWTKGTF